MEYLYVSIGIFIIGLILFIVGLKKEKLTVEEAVEKHKEYLENLTIQQKEEYRQRCTYRKALEEDIQRAKYIYEVVQQRAAEAQAATQQLLESEQGRLAAELKSAREIEEIRMQHDFEQKYNLLEQDFNNKKKTLEDNFHSLSESYCKQLSDLTLKIEDYEAKQAVIHDAIIREREIQEKENFYRINIKENDIKDIEVLRSIEPRLVNHEVLNKLIYEAFIKRPFIEMEKRVLKGRKIGGIYKITYTKTGESYIGRSVDIANRWKEHCLSSLNIGTIAHSTFHNALADKGLQNFTWEVLEEVERDKQAVREKYWIEFYQTDKQFNQKAGG